MVLVNSRTNRLVRPALTSRDPRGQLVDEVDPNHRATTSTRQQKEQEQEEKEDHLDEEQLRLKRHRLRHRRTKKEDRPEVLKVKREVQQVMQTVNDRFEELEKGKRLQQDAGIHESKTSDATKSQSPSTSSSSPPPPPCQTTTNGSIVSPCDLPSHPAAKSTSAADKAIMEYARESIMPVKMKTDKTSLNQRRATSGVQLDHVEQAKLINKALQDGGGDDGDDDDNNGDKRSSLSMAEKMKLFTSANNVPRDTGSSWSKKRKNNPDRFKTQPITQEEMTLASMIAVKNDNSQDSGDNVEPSSMHERLQALKGKLLIEVKTGDDVQLDTKVKSQRRPTSGDTDDHVTKMKDSVRASVTSCSAKSGIESKNAASKVPSPPQCTGSTTDNTSIAATPVSTITSPTTKVGVQSSPRETSQAATMRLQPVQRTPEKRKSGILKKERTFECRKALASRAGSADSPAPTSSHDNTPIPLSNRNSPSGTSPGRVSPTTNSPSQSALERTSSDKRCPRDMSTSDLSQCSKLPCVASPPLERKIPNMDSTSQTDSVTVSPEQPSPGKSTTVDQVSNPSSRPKSPSAISSKMNTTHVTPPQSSTANNTSLSAATNRSADKLSSDSSASRIRAHTTNSPTYKDDVTTPSTTTTTECDHTIGGTQHRTTVLLEEQSAVGTTPVAAVTGRIAKESTGHDDASKPKTTTRNQDHSPGITSTQISKNNIGQTPRTITPTNNPKSPTTPPIITTPITPASPSTPTTPTTCTTTATSNTTACKAVAPNKSTSPSTKPSSSSTSPLSTTTSSSTLTSSTSTTTSTSSTTSSTSATATRSKVNKTLSMMGSTFNKIKSRAFGRPATDKDSSGKTQISDGKVTSKMAEKIAGKSNKAAERMAGKQEMTDPAKTLNTNKDGCEAEVWKKQVGVALQEEEKVAKLLGVDAGDCHVVDSPATVANDSVANDNNKSSTPRVLVDCPTISINQRLAALNQHSEQAWRSKVKRSPSDISPRRRHQGDEVQPPLDGASGAAKGAVSSLAKELKAKLNERPKSIHVDSLLNNLRNNDATNNNLHKTTPPEDSDNSCDSCPSSYDSAHSSAEHAPNSKSGKIIGSIANRMSCLEGSQGSWKNRVSSKDAQQFTIEAKMKREDLLPKPPVYSSLITKFKMAGRTVYILN